MIREFQAFFTLFKKGKEVANPAAWKKGQIRSNDLALVLSAAALIAKGFGYDFNIDESTLEIAGAGVIAFYAIGNKVLTVITSKKVGK